MQSRMLTRRTVPIHGLVQINLHDITIEVSITDFGQVLPNVGLKLLQEDSVFSDLTLFTNQTNQTNQTYQTKQNNQTKHNKSRLL